MIHVKSKNRYIPHYENGSSFSEIARYLKSQLANNKPQEIPKGFFNSSYALQGGALGSQILGLAGQKTEETPFVANPSDVSAAYQKIPVGTGTALLDNFLLGQQQSMARHLNASGGDTYATANALAKPMADAGRTRSEAALNLLNQNVQQDRGRAMFNIEQDRGINAATNMQRQNENQKLAALSGKVAEGAGAFSNLRNNVFETEQKMEYMNNLKVSQLINQLFTANFYDKMYPNDPVKKAPADPTINKRKAATLIPGFGSLLPQ